MTVTFHQAFWVQPDLDATASDLAALVRLRDVLGAVGLDARETYDGHEGMLQLEWSCPNDRAPEVLGAIAAAGVRPAVIVAYGPPNEVSRIRSLGDALGLQVRDR